MVPFCLIKPVIGNGGDDIDIRELREVYPGYISDKLQAMADELRFSGELCTFVIIGELKTPYILSLSPHTYKRVRERLGIYDRNIFFNAVVDTISSNVELGNAVDADTENITPPGTMHKLCLLLELFDWFIYLHIHEEGRIEISTVVCGEPIYYVDPDATAVWLKSDGEVVTGIENIPSMRISKNTKYNKQIPA